MGRHGRVRTLLATLLATMLGGPASADPTAERVILVHGLARGAGSMAPLAERLERAGFVTHNLDYASTEHEPEALVSWLEGEIEGCCADGAAPLHFVTHSLGGILVRAALERERPTALGRVVLIAPPNGGSQIVDSLGANPLFGAVLGPTATMLGTGPDSFPNRIGPPDYELGIIAGTASINPLGSALLPGPDDGAVTVEDARLEGAADFILADANHTFIMQDAEVGRQVVHFLLTGGFDHGEAALGQRGIPSRR